MCACYGVFKSDRPSPSDRSFSSYGSVSLPLVGRTLAESIPDGMYTLSHSRPSSSSARGRYVVRPRRSHGSGSYAVPYTFARSIRRRKPFCVVQTAIPSPLRGFRDAVVRHPSIRFAYRCETPFGPSTSSYPADHVVPAMQINTSCSDHAVDVRLIIQNERNCQMFFYSSYVRR